jgi:virginiamycin B lyase
MKLPIATAVLLAFAACSSAQAPTYRALPPALLFGPASSNAMKLTGYYNIPSFGPVYVDGMIAGPDKRLWFTTFQGSYVGAITTAGVVSTYAVSSSAQLNGIAVGPKRKNFWAAGFGGAIDAIALSGSQTSYAVPSGHMSDVAIGPDKNVWFNDYGNNKVGRITRGGVVTEFALPAGAVPDSLAFGSDKNLWVLDGGRRLILKMNLSGTVVGAYRRGLTPHEYFGFIVTAPDGNLYFDQYAHSTTVGDTIGRLSVSGKIAKLGTLPPGSSPGRLCVGKDRNVYFSLNDLQAVGKIDTASGKVSFSWQPFTRDSGTYSIANGPDGRLWLGGGSTIYAVTY